MRKHTDWNRVLTGALVATPAIEMHRLRGIWSGTTQRNLQAAQLAERRERRRQELSEAFKAMGTTPPAGFGAMIAWNKRQAALLKELRSIQSGEWTPLDAAKNNANWHAQSAARHAQNAQYFAGRTVANHCARRAGLGRREPNRLHATSRAARSWANGDSDEDGHGDDEQRSTASGAHPHSPARRSPLPTHNERARTPVRERSRSRERPSAPRQSRVFALATRGIARADPAAAHNAESDDDHTARGRSRSPSSYYRSASTGMLMRESAYNRTYNNGHTHDDDRQCDRAAAGRRVAGPVLPADERRAAVL